MALLPTNTGATVTLRLTFPYKRLRAGVQTTVVKRLSWRDTRWLNAEIGWNGNPREDRNCVRPGLSRSASDSWSELEELLSAGPTAQAPSTPNPLTTGLSELPSPWGAEGSLWGGALEKMLCFHLLPFVQTCPPHTLMRRSLPPTQETRLRPKPWVGKTPLEEGTAAPCSMPARELHGQRQQSIGSQRVGHHWALTLPLSTPSSFPTPAPGNYTQLPGQLPREGDSSCSGPELPSSFTTGHSDRRSWPLYRHLSDQGGVCYGQRWQQRRHLRRAQTAGRPQGTACFLSWNLFMWPSRGCAARRRSCVPHRGAGKHHWSSFLWECIWMHVPNYLTVNILKEKN